MTHPRLQPFEGKRVLVTGHTGFKGSWLAAWLHRLGADVHGFALPAPERGAFHDLNADTLCSTTIGDVRDPDAVKSAVDSCNPDLVMHLAAQPLVRLSWADRAMTYGTNVMGTVNTLEASLANDSVRGVVCVTTDKVYLNNEEGRPFVEGDRLGGHDPYSASKAAAEIAVAPYHSPQFMGLREVPVVTVRAGNVIGGGDWSADRLVPDIARALEAGENITLRRPNAVRPWQHVLDCVYGYLLVGAEMLEANPLSRAYNLAHDGGAATVIEVTSAVVKYWGASEDRIVVEAEDDAKEAGLLTLDPALAQKELGWAPAWTLDESLEETVRFYRDTTLGGEQLDSHMAITGAR